MEKTVEMNENRITNRPLPKLPNEVTIKSLERNNRIESNTKTPPNSINKTIAQLKKTSVESVNSTRSNTHTFRRTDVIKSGRLHIKKNNSILGIKKWNERALTLRDTWTETGQSGVTSLEIFHPSFASFSSSFSSTKQHQTSFYSNKKSSFFSFFNCFTESSRTSLESSTKVLPISISKRKISSNIDRCYIDLSTVSSVHEHPSRKPFPHAFVINRKDKEPLIFGAKTEFEAKEWMVAVRHLAEKAHQTTVSRNTHPHVLTFEDGLESLKKHLVKEEAAIPLRQAELMMRKTSLEEGKNDHAPKPPPRPRLVK